MRYTLGDGIIVANLVPLCQVLAGNYRPLTAQLVTFLTLCCLFNIRQISNNILAMPGLELFLGLIPQSIATKLCPTFHLIMCASTGRSSAMFPRPPFQAREVLYMTPLQTTVGSGVAILRQGKTLIRRLLMNDFA